NLLARPGRDRADRGVLAVVPLRLQRRGQVLLGAVVDQVGEPHLVHGQQQQDQAERDERLPDAAQEGTDPVTERAAWSLRAAVATTSVRRLPAAAPALPRHVDPLLGDRPGSLGLALPPAGTGR